jgi:class 3 adenylate cyclase
MVERPVSADGNPELFSVVAAFVGRDQPAQPVGSARGQAGTAVILFTDIADSTALTERLGDTAFRERSRALDTNIRTAIRNAGGATIEGKVLGDGVMGVFSSAAQAIAAARRCVELGGELPMHIGLHAGDVIREGDNVYGGAVNIASRICGLCEPGEILVSGTVRDLARTSAGVTFEDRGEHALKGIADPVRVFAVRAVA